MTKTADDLIRSVARAARGQAMFDAQMRYLAASATWLADHSLTDSVVGRSLYEVFPKIREDWKAVHRRCLAGATERSERDQGSGGRGGAHWVAWEVRPWRDRSGAIGGIVIASEDITARVEARERPEERQNEPRPADLSEGGGRAVAARIASVRFRLDRTERDFAALLGVPRAAVTAWESGRGVDRDVLRRIAEMTDTSFEWLADGLMRQRGGADREAEASARGATGTVYATADERIKPQRLVVGGDLPKAITSAWKLRREGLAEAADRESDASEDRPSAVFLGLPGASLCLGARAPGYGLEKSRYRSAEAELLLNFGLEGRCRVEQMGREFESGEGRAVFTSSFEGGRYFYQSGGRYLSVAVPARILQERVPDVESRLMRPIAPDSPPLRLLTAYVSGLMKSDTGLDREAARPIADHLADLCALLLGATGDERALAETRGVRAAQRSAIRDAIEASAATPGFSAQTVAERLNVSPRYVHFLLEEAGAGFGSLVTARRLDVVRSRLADPKFAGMTIPEIATACGFADLQRFQLQFVSRFGDKASALRAKG